MYIKKNRLIVLALLVLASHAAIPFAKNLVPTADSKITLTPAEALPQRETQLYSKGIDAISGDGNFFITIHLPGSKVITEVKIHYTDTLTEEDPCFTLWKTKPVDGTFESIGTICGTGTTTGVETLTIQNIDTVISPSNGLILTMNLTGPTSHRFLGAKVFYRNP